MIGLIIISKMSFFYLIRHISYLDILLEVLYDLFLILRGYNILVDLDYIVVEIVFFIVI